MNRFLTSLLIGLFFFAASPAVSFAGNEDTIDRSVEDAAEASSECVANTNRCSCESESGSPTSTTATDESASDAACDEWCGKMHGVKYTRTCTLGNGDPSTIGQGNQGDTTPTAGLADIAV